VVITIMLITSTMIVIVPSWSSGIRHHDDPWSFTSQPYMAERRYQQRHQQNYISTHCITPVSCHYAHGM